MDGVNEVAECGWPAGMHADGSEAYCVLPAGHRLRDPGSWHSPIQPAGPNSTGVFYGLSLRELEEIPRGWRYDAAHVVRDSLGNLVDTAAWSRARLAALMREGLSPSLGDPERARAQQLATLAEELLGKYAALQLEAWQVAGEDELPESVREELEEFRDQLALATCDGDHDEHEPHTDFRRTG